MHQMHMLQKIIHVVVHMPWGLPSRVLILDNVGDGVECRKQ